MKIDHARAQKAFADYAAHYNADDPKVKLKVDHTCLLYTSPSPRDA
mgnify:CR=1 FL=1